MVLVDDAPQIITTTERPLRHLPLVIDFTDPRSAIAYVSTLSAPADIVWTSLRFPAGILGLTILQLAARRAPRPDLFLVTAADTTTFELPDGIRVFAKPNLRVPIAAIERIVLERLLDR